MKLVGFAGLARSGKDTVADIWEANRKCHRYALADPVRKTAAAMFRLPIEIFSGSNPDREKVIPYWGLSPRRMLQLVGTECGRENITPALWTKHASLQLDDVYSKNDEKPEYFLVTDIRFEDEATWIRHKNGIVIHIIRDVQDSAAKHASEMGVAVKSRDQVIYNIGDLDNLKKEVEIAIITLEAKL